MQCPPQKLSLEEPIIVNNKWVIVMPMTSEDKELLKLYSAMVDQNVSIIHFTIRIL